MRANHRKTDFQAMMSQEYLRTMRRTLTLKQDIFQLLRANTSTLQHQVPIYESVCKTMLTHIWRDPIKPFPNSCRFQCCRIFDTDGSIRSQIPYDNFFTQKELGEWFKLPHQVKRRQEWLLGRLAAKDAVRLLLRDRYGLEVYPLDIEITKERNGKPIIGGELNKKLGLLLSISIAHSGGTSVAIAGDCGDHNCVGIDIEQICQSSDGLKRVTLTGEERSLLSTVPVSTRDEWFLRLWCAKEAVAKAVGQGMVGGPRSLVVKNLEVGDGRVDLTLAGELARRLPGYGNILITAHTGRQNTYVFASSLIDEVSSSEIGSH